MAATAREDDAASNRKAEEDFSPEEAAHQKANSTVARTAADIDECSDDEDDPFIRNLNLMARRNLMTPEWIENAKKSHYEQQALIDSIYDALENGEIESDSDGDDDEAAQDIWASVDLSRLNTVDGEYAVAVYPVGVYPLKSRSEDKDNDADASAAAGSSS